MFFWQKCFINTAIIVRMIYSHLIIYDYFILFYFVLDIPCVW